MSEELLLRHCSPTLAGIKTGSLFGATYSDISEINTTVRDLNRRLSVKGIRVLPIKVSGDRALIYVYRPTKLKDDLSRIEAREILEKRGYECERPGLCVTKLMKTLKDSNDFPHEIGLFLGYPPEDVSGFIEDSLSGTKHSKMSGYWKVYGDVGQAEKLFMRYKKCTQTYCKLWKNGKTIERLTVS